MYFFRFSLLELITIKVNAVDEGSTQLCRDRDFIIENWMANECRML